MIGLVFPQPVGRAHAYLRYPLPPPPPVSAQSWILYDDTWQLTIASHNADEHRPMASTTKMMTALLTIENSSPDETVVVSDRAERTNFTQLGLVTGQEWTVGELLEGLVVVSANDAAVALAEHVSGDVEAFVELMNAKAVDLGLEDTSYENPHGFDAPNHYTTARDLMELGRIAMESPEYAGLAALPEVTVESATGRGRRWESTNDLLATLAGAIGVKTGKTRGAGEVLVSAAERDGRRIYAVVMGSKNAVADSTALLEFGFDVFQPSGLRLVDDNDNAPQTDLDPQPEAGPVGTMGRREWGQMAIDHILTEVVSAEAIEARVGELAAEISDDYSERVPVVVGVLNAALIFMADLVREMTVNHEAEFLAVSRFGEGGRVKIAMDTSVSLEDRHVLLVEDLVDTGLTHSFLTELFHTRNVASMSTVTLIDKAPRRIVDVQLDYRGFEVGEEFLVGYGLDYEGRYRNVRSLWAVQDFEAFTNDPDVLARELFASDRVAG